MDKEAIFKMANILDTALRESKEIERLTRSHPQLSLAEAYSIQNEGISFRLNRGEKVLGFKMGLTSKAKQEQMNLRKPIYGVLTDRMRLEDRELFSIQGLIHPKIEPEIAFFIGKEIRAGVSRDEALAACSGVCAAMEIIDSRYLNFKYFSLEDVVADNCSSAFFVISSEVKSPKGIDLSNLEMTMKINGICAQKGYSNSISSHPGNSLVQLCELLAERGHTLPAGSIVLAGAATQAVQLEPGLEIQLMIEQLGSVHLSTAQL